tara:strand:- start:3375 stop:3770 length:396 start_codon:yes stop_codon:yes gene_type:complete
MKNWFNYKDTISGKTYLYRSLIVGIPLSIIYFLLEEVNYYAGSLFGISMYIIFFSFRYKRMSAVFKDNIDLGKKLFYISVSLDLFLELYYLFNIELAQSDDFTLIDLITLPSAIFILYILFKDSVIEKHNG